MRRVVADQIKALNELTDVVARSGRSYDIAEPVRRPDARSTRPPRRIEPMRQSEPPTCAAPGTGTCAGDRPGARRGRAP